MKIKEEGISIRGNVLFEVFDAVTGNLIQSWEQHNLITTQGLGAMLKLVSGKSTSYVRYCAVGTGTTAESRTHTGLIGTVLKRKERAEAYNSEISANKYKCSIKTFFGRNDGNGSWGETGLFTVDNNTSMINRVKLDTVFVKDITKTTVITFTWDLSEGSVI